MPAGAAAQVFIASRPHPQFTVGPLFVRAIVTPALDHTEIEVRFGLEVAPNVPGAQIQQTLYLLWPGEVLPAVATTSRADGDRAARKKADKAAKGDKAAKAEPTGPDPALARFVEERGYKVRTQGVLPLLTRDIYGGRESEHEVAGAPFVTFFRDRSANGETPPATWIRLPWRQEMINRAHLMSLRFSSKEILKRERATWLDETFRGRRHLISLSFHEVRSRGMFPLYLEHRDRVVKLSEDPSQLTLVFRDPDHLKIESVTPPTATRRLSDGRQASQLVSLFLDRSEGIAPQLLTVQFGYFRGIHSWMPILIPTLFFLLGNLAAVGVRVGAERLSKHFSGRLLWGRAPEPPQRETGVIVPRETLARIAPGETSVEKLMEILGASPEEHERLDGSGRRTLVYRGRRLVPHRNRTVGFLTTVSHWDAEDHELEILIEGNRVRDLQARIRRSRVNAPNGNTVK